LTFEPVRPLVVVALLLGGALGSTACVEYVPVELGAVPPGEEVRVRVRDDAAVRLGRHFGQIREELSASVEPQGPDSVSVIVWLGKDYPGTAFENVRETVVVGRDDVTELRIRRVSVWRTAVASAGAVAAFALLVHRLVQGESPNRQPDDGGFPPPAFRSPLIRIPVGGIP
jgi:hypothetical protein